MNLENVKLKIFFQDVTFNNIDDFIDICIPNHIKDDKYMIDGRKEKLKWMNDILKHSGKVGKVAYVNSEPIGMLQYLENPDDNIININCIFIPNKKFHKKGIAKQLVEGLISEIKDKSIFNAITIHAFEIPSFYSQKDFFNRLGFTQVPNGDEFFLYYPLRPDFVMNQINVYIPQEEDKNKILVFFDPSCPFCVSFLENYKRILEEILPDYPIRVINKFTEPDEIKKRGKIPYCVVNNVAIKSFYTERDKFKEEVLKAAKVSDLKD